MGRLETTTPEAMLKSWLTRRMALRYAVVAGTSKLLEQYGVREVAAQEGTPVTASSLDDYPEVVIVGADFSFELPASIPGGLTRLTLQNDGDVDHHAMFMRLNDDADMADLEAALSTPDPGPIFAVSQSLGGPEVGPGLQASVIADLTPGQYMVICIVPEMDGTPHYMMGMYAPLEVTEPAGSASPPAADMTVDLVDFAFEMPTMEVPAGPQIWEAPNVGEQLHEMVIFQLAPGVTLEQVEAIFTTLPEPGGTPVAETAMATPPPGPPPFTLVGGVAPMSPGFTNWAVLDLEPGDYLANCFVPDPVSGKPHFELGMIMPFTVS
jgi:hypothetical protein